MRTVELPGSISPDADDFDWGPLSIPIEIKHKPERIARVINFDTGTVFENGIELSQVEAQRIIRQTVTLIKEITRKICT